MRRFWQIDLIDFFTGARPWWEFMVFLDGLPSMGSEFREAQRNAPEVVTRLLELSEEGLPQWSPVGSEWTLRDELTAALFDRVGQLLSVEVARNTGKAPKPPQPFPRPVRAIDLARSELEREYLGELDDEVAAAQARWRAAREGEPDVER